MEIEVKRLASEQEKLDRDWRRIPFLLSFVVTSIPAYLLWGGWAALYAILFTPCLVIAATYLVGVRRAETRAAMAELQRALAEQKRSEH